MAIPIFDKLGMYLRRSPVAKIEQCVKRAAEAGITVPFPNIEAHYLCGADFAVVLEAYILARKESVQTCLDELCAIDLSRHDPLEAVRLAIPAHQLAFDKYAPDKDEYIEGACRNGKLVRATCTLDYTLPVGSVFGTKLEQVQEALAARLSVWICGAVDEAMLERQKANCEEDLLGRAVAVMPTIRKVTVDYKFET
ncbi:MAG: flotillin-like FloA family protein [Planctomycetota bacterium]